MLITTKMKCGCALKELKVAIYIVNLIFYSMLRLFVVFRENAKLF